MASYNNFFETVNEAYMRLRGTFVLYDGEPYTVLCITNHKDDGIWRIYLDPLGYGKDQLAYNMANPPPCGNCTSDYPGLGAEMDKWLDKMQTPEQGGTGPGTKVIRKMMNSPKFNKFRPYPLGMCNFDGRVYYLERQPTRKSEQGLTHGMISSQDVNLLPTNDKQRLGRSGMVDLYGPSFLACIKGDHPSAQECLDNLQDPEIANDAAAFHRQFALVRGPLGMIFLAYKADIIGVLPNKDLSVLRVGRDFRHTREVVEILGTFGTVEQD